MVAISIMRKFTEAARPTRSLYLNWPMGHPFGEPDNIQQQMRILRDAFTALQDITNPGAIIDLPYRWGRPEDMSKFKCACE